MVASAIGRALAKGGEKLLHNPRALPNALETTRAGRFALRHPVVTGGGIAAALAATDPFGGDEAPEVAESLPGPKNVHPTVAPAESLEAEPLDVPSIFDFRRTAPEPRLATAPDFTEARNKLAELDPKAPEGPSKAAQLSRLLGAAAGGAARGGVETGQILGAAGGGFSREMGQLAIEKQRRDELFARRRQRAILAMAGLETQQALATSETSRFNAQVQNARDNLQFQHDVATIGAGMPKIEPGEVPGTFVATWADPKTGQFQRKLGTTDEALEKSGRLRIALQDMMLRRQAHGPQQILLQTGKLLDLLGLDTATAEAAIWANEVMGDQKKLELVLQWMEAQPGGEHVRLLADPRAGEDGKNQLFHAILHVAGNQDFQNDIAGDKSEEK